MNESVAESMEAGSPAMGRPLLAALALGFAFSAWLIWGFDPLPSADLPQHAAQLGLFRSLGDPAFAYAGQFELNYFTPYLLAYLVAGAFALVLPVAAAVKATLQLALVGWVWASWRFQRRVGGDPWWCLLAFPLFFGFSFLWGFLNYLLAVPLALLAVELYDAWGEGPAAGAERGRGTWLAAVGVALFFAHGMACVFGLAVGAAAAWARSGARDGRSLLRLIAPALPAALLTVAWRQLNPELDLSLRWRAWQEQLSLFRTLLGGPTDDLAALFSGALLLLALVFLLADRAVLAALPARAAWARRLPLLLTLAYVLLMPDRLGSLYHANRRFLVFLPLFAGGWLARRPGWRRPALIGLFVLAWLAVLAPRFAQVESALGPAGELIGRLPEGKRLLYLRIGEDHNAFEMPFALHQGAWYAARRGGLADFSFAAFSTELVRYAPGRQPELPIGFEHRPWAFDLMGLASFYDLWLIYAPGGAAATLPPDRFRLLDRNGDWWAYEIVRAP